MARRIEKTDLQQLTRLGPILKRFSIHRMDLCYDEEVDVLYVKFADTEPICKSDLTKDDILVEYDKEKNVVGVTILDASNR